jgi:hypothetical protein
MTDTLSLHATAIAVDGQGLLLTGPSGSGKSDLALRLLRQGARLVSDDLVLLSGGGGRLIASRPPALPPRLAVAGIGVVVVGPAIDNVPLSLALALTPLPANSPESTLGVFGPIAGLSLPQVALFAKESSAVDKVMLALDRWGL